MNTPFFRPQTAIESSDQGSVKDCHSTEQICHSPALFNVDAKTFSSGILPGLELVDHKPGHSKHNEDLTLSPTDFSRTPSLEALIQSKKVTVSDTTIKLRVFREGVEPPTKPIMVDTLYERQEQLSKLTEEKYIPAKKYTFSGDLIVNVPDSYDTRLAAQREALSRPEQKKQVPVLIRPEHIYHAFQNNFPHAGPLREIQLLNEQDPQIFFVVRGNSGPTGVFARNEADAWTSQGKIRLFSNLSLTSLDYTFKHEFFHLLELDPLFGSAYKLARELEKDGYRISNYLTGDLREDFAEHGSRGFLSVNSNDFQKMVETSPLRAIALAGVFSRYLERSNDQNSTLYKRLEERVEFVQNTVLPRAIEKLRSIESSFDMEKSRMAKQFIESFKKYSPNNRFGNETLQKLLQY